MEETESEKINIIAHSKGGLDCRAVMDTDAGKYIASLTTINTPHKGCEFADYMFHNCKKLKYFSFLIVFKYFLYKTT